MTSKAVVSLSVALFGCAAPSSTLMIRSDDTAHKLTPDKATILFVSDLAHDSFGQPNTHAGIPYVVFDENTRFLGELIDVASFEVQVTPGKHMFAAAASRSTLASCFAFRGEFAAGKYYVAWLRFQQVGTNQLQMLKWLFPRPDSHSIHAADVMAGAPRFQGDMVQGQKLVDEAGNAESNARSCKPMDEVYGNQAPKYNPPEWGFDTVPH